ncbi:MAG: alpha-2-macroglobulin, partial [Chloroflexota bacterium]|nr:alpha-2-macroglobulin [Chloroflexota bacterium]
MLRARVVLPILLLVLFIVVACGGKPVPAPTFTPEVIMGSSGTPIASRGGSAGPAGQPAATPTAGAGLRLSAGQEPAEQVVVAPTAPAQPLTAAEAQQVLGRLPGLALAEGDQQAFALRPGSLPAPRPGQTIALPFPPPTSTLPPPEGITGGALEVLRYQPEGDVPLAPYLSVTFNQPMVALTSVDDLAQGAVPVKLSPAPAGKWRWVGTKTLMFEPSGRFPMATKYTVEVPAGIKSATGGTLAAAVRWTFTTPPPTLNASYPTRGPTRRDVLMFAAFDQRIDPAAVLATVKVTGEGTIPIAVRLATAQEAQADSAVSWLIGQAGEGRWLAFRATEPLPADSSITVAIGPGTPSGEGPLSTTGAQTFSFKTYGALQAKGARCGYNNQCPPLYPWQIEFTNPLDAVAFDPAWVKIQPELPGAKIAAQGNFISIQGRSQGRTSYRIQVSAALRDMFDQTLGYDNAFTILVGSAYPSVSAPGGNFLTLDPSAKKPSYSIYSINYERLKVTAYRVTPNDWATFKTYLRDYNRSERRPALPGVQAFSRTIAIKAKDDEMVETAIDLSEAMSDGLGQVVVVVEPDAGRWTSLLGRQKPPVLRAWVQSTRIGLDAFADADNLLVWASALADGGALNGVEIRLAPAGGSAKTNDAGLATLALPHGNSGSLAVARKGADIAILPENTSIWSDGGWQRQPQNDTLRWYVFDDRGIYRPGEEVHVKGWIRVIGAGPGGDVLPLAAPGSQVSWRVRDSRGNEVRTGTAAVNVLGGFTMAFTLAETMNLGNATVALSLNGGPSADGAQHSHVFQVQEFRRPEFEVKASASEGPHFVGGNATASVAATYYAGGGLPDAAVTWRVSQATGSYSPPGWADFTFGTWTPWWGGGGMTLGVAGKPSFPGDLAGQTSETFAGRTDAAGIHRLRLDFPSALVPPAPIVVKAEASVMDVNRQAWNAATSLLVHPAELYVGIRSERIFVQREQPLKVEAIVTDLDGKPVPGVKISLRAARLDWQYKAGEWKQIETVVQPCTITSANEPVTCAFETPEGGTYRIVATVADSKGRPNQSQFDRWVSGGQRPVARKVEQEEVTLIPDKKDYKPGDTAEILVQAPFY